jgi:membrane protein YdbS with pleckstrin-like domain
MNLRRVPMWVAIALLVLAIAVDVFGHLQPNRGAYFADDICTVLMLVSLFIIPARRQAKTY